MTPENKTVEIEVNDMRPGRGRKTVMVVTDKGAGKGVKDAFRKHLLEQGFLSPDGAITPVDPEVEALRQAQADRLAGKVTYLDIPESEIPVPELPPFSVENRTRAEKIVKMLYGPKARVRTFPNQDQAKTQVVLQEGSRAIVLREAPDLSALLSEPVESYVKGGKDLQDVEKRIYAAGSLVELGLMAYRAMMQFPEYMDKRRRQVFKQREIHRQAQESKVPFKDLVAEARKTLRQDSEAAQEKDQNDHPEGVVDSAQPSGA